jgi:hypothetical protein
MHTKFWFENLKGKIPQGAPGHTLKDLGETWSQIVVDWIELAQDMETDGGLL